MRARALAVGSLLVIGGCRAVLGIEEAPDGPGATSGATTDVVASTSETVSAASSSDGGSSQGGEGGLGQGTLSSGGAGGGDGGGAGSAEGGGGSGTGGSCACGEVRCCLTTCEDGVCAAATLGPFPGLTRRLASDGISLAVTLENANDTRVTRLPLDAAEGAPLPADCLLPTQDAARGHIALHDGVAYYANDANDAEDGVVTRVDAACDATTFLEGRDVQTMEPPRGFAGLAVRGDQLLMVDREPADASRVLCRTFTDVDCDPLVSEDAGTSDGHAIALDGADPVWTLRLKDPLGAAASSDAAGSVVELASAGVGVPVDVELSAAGTPHILVLGELRARVIDRDDGSVRCSIKVGEGIGIGFADDFVVLPTVDGFAVCTDDFESCRAARTAPIRDVLVTDDAVFLSLGYSVLRVQRPLDALVATLESVPTICTAP